MKDSIYWAGGKAAILVGHAAMVAAAFMVALQLRYEGQVPDPVLLGATGLLLPLVIIKLGSFALMRLYSGWWRYVSIPDLLQLLYGNLCASLLFYLYTHLWFPLPGTLTWSVFVLDGLFCFLLMSGARVAVRLAREATCTRSRNRSEQRRVERVLVVGAGAIGQSVVREVRQNPKLRWNIVGYVDQDADRRGQSFQGVRVLAGLDGLDGLLGRMSIDQVVLANHALTGSEKRAIVATCRQHDVKSLILPGVSAILTENVSIRDIRDVKLEDLLGRPPVALEIDEIRRYLQGKRILVTGAAGSIGREICRQVAEFGASSVVLFDNAESPLFFVERELKTAFPHVVFTPSLSDVRNPIQVDFAFTRFAPQVVFHAAAYKHVPMSEDNPVATIENNVLGTRNLADTACRHAVEHFVMVSTDKAVNPTNIMGASKRAAEVYVQALAEESSTSIVTVRFGNVLGSNGSVVPIFQEQIRNGGPVTVTDPKATRFFMTIPEAVQLVLQAGSMGQGGEIFILNMGEQLRIVHLAEELIRLSGKTPYHDVDIVYTGLRPGEKLHEELLLDEEDVVPTRHEKICVAQSRRHDHAALCGRLDRLALCCRNHDRETLLVILKQLVPEYGLQTRLRTNPALSRQPSAPALLTIGRGAMESV